MSTVVSENCVVPTWGDGEAPEVGEGVAAGAAARDVEDVEEVRSFDEMGLPDSVLRGVYSYGFNAPSRIQMLAVVPMAAGRDIIAQAQAGSGKTAAFVLGVLARVSPAERHVQACIVSPTRELADQSYEVAKALGQHAGVGAIVVKGGDRLGDALSALRRGDAHVLSATPGRLLDMACRRQVDLSHVRVLVLDEADKLLSEEGGFEEQVSALYKGLPKGAQTALFSATLSPEVMDIAHSILQRPVQILVKNEDLTLRGISQFHVACERDEFKLATLMDLYESFSVSQSLIYTNSTRTADWLGQQMTEQGFPVSVIHSQMDTQERMATMSDFRKGSSRVLVSTDLLARGIDVQQVGVVINFELPHQVETYIHRIGRSGRFGRKGVAVNLVSENDVMKLRGIEQFYATSVPELRADWCDFL